MRKFLLAAGVIAAALIPALPAQATGTHVKVEICHWANGNPHSIEVSENAADYPITTNHGAIGVGFTFTPHATPGHAEDFLVRVFTKHGNDETNLYVNTRKCEVAPPPVVDPPTSTTTTTVPEVPEAPHVVCPDGNGFTFKQAPGPCPEIIKEKVGGPGTTPTSAPPAPAAPQPLTELPRTGGGALALAGLGGALAAAGLVLRRLAR